MSLAISGFRIRLLPVAKEASATARIVWDFEAGIAAVPTNRDFFVISFIFFNFVVNYVFCFVF